MADVIADVVETGSTLRQAGLEVFGDVILDSEAVLITRAGADRLGGFEVFRRRLEGVLVARTYVMMDYDIPTDRGRRRGRADARHREPHRLAAASGGLGRRTRDGPAQRRPAADGRALRDRCPRHPGHRHPCLPTLSPARAAPVLPHTWRPFGVRLVGLVAGLGLLAVCVAAWIALGEDLRSQFTPFES